MLPSQKVLEFEQSLSEIERLIQTGNVQKARIQICLLTKKKLPRPILSEVARLARRVNLANISLRILNPIVRSTSRIPLIASDLEKAEYAAALVWDGIILEAKWLLKDVDRKKTPFASLALAYAHIFEWNYAEAVPLLREYLCYPLTSYEQLIGKVNLAASLIFIEALPEAKELLHDLRALSKDRYARIYANVLELSAQLEIASKEYKAANDYLKEADLLLKGAPVFDMLYIEKWQIICNLHTNKNKATIKNSLELLQQKAMASSHWETVRECDKYLALLQKDQELLQKVYFGTPFPSYRERLLKEFSGKFTPPKVFEWNMGAEKKPEKLLSLFDTTLNEKQTDIKVGSTVHRLLHLMSSDFYKPFTTAAVFAGIFPGEYFHPTVGPARVYQAVGLLKNWCKKNKFPLKIVTQNGYYHLEGAGKVGIRLAAKEFRKHPQLRTLYDHFQEQPFNAKQASTKLKLPLRSLQRFLSGMVSEGLLVVTGTKSQVKYHIKKKS